MKKNAFVYMAGLVLLVGAILWGLWPKRAAESFETGPKVKAPQDDLSFQKKAASQPQLVKTNSLSRIQRILADPQSDWKTPISFYGKVVDENGQPMEGADIGFTWNDISPRGTSKSETKSDAQGLFSLTGVRGKGVTVRVQKDGYYTSQEQNQFSFEMANEHEDEYYKPDPSNPVIFHLRKKGRSEPLLVFKKGFKIPKDGTPIEIDLLLQKIVPLGQGHLRVECWTDDMRLNEKNQFNWKCRVAIPNGGVIESVGEFDFVAPENGYGPTMEIDMPQGAEGWDTDVDQKLFIKAANGQIYARGVFKIIVRGDHFFKFEGYVNPSGSRNLEYDSNMQIERYRIEEVGLEKAIQEVEKKNQNRERVP